MRFKKYGKRLLALLMSAVFVATTVMSGVGGMNQVEAASVYEPTNLLVNPDFEDSKAFGQATTSHLGNWFVWQSVAKTTEEAYSGTTSAKFSASDSALEQDITGLQKGMTYVYTVWVKLSGTNSTAAHTVGVKNYGGEEIKVNVTETEWTKKEIEFTYTEGNPRVYGYTATHGGVHMYIDNASVVAKSDIQRAEIKNGELAVTFVNGFNGTISTNDFSAVYKTNAESGNVKELVWTESLVDGNVLKLKFAEVAAIPVAQTVTVDVTYKGQTFTVDYEVEASGEDVVVAKLESVEAENGTVKAVLDKAPSVAPVASDFTWEYKKNDGAFEKLGVDGFVYDKDSKTVQVTFDEIRGIPSGEQTVTVKVIYGETAKEDSFVVAKGSSRVYYVDASNGNDNNDGLSEEEAFASIDKLNTITFLPGDEILFKKGETFTGCFKPQGSGMEDAPIRIGSYGAGDERPVLEPGADWTVSHVMSANAIVRNAKVNYVIQFYNVEYWEVSDLEIRDPRSEAYLTQGSGIWIGNSANDVYRSGITIQAEDIGTLEHIYVDNVIIHGFHGPGTNIGKTSGGITMNVITNADRNRSLSVPTQINDIRVTNCEIYDVGRSGINFLTPWSFRTEEKWGPFDYGTRGYDYLPYEDFYMANNFIHDVDGDGTIIDNCSGAVAEYNLVTKCCLRPATTGGGAAVGLFNWNSDDTYFQFNEVYGIEDGSGASASNDSQGIEIDALNDRTWVQYNYVHDNTGGFMMLCNVGDQYRSFDGIVRYNISQDDYTHPRQGMFDIYSANYGTEIYNNTFYMTDRAVSQNGYGSYVKAGELFLFSAVGSYDTMKFYNNIFYYDGATPVKANKFGDESIDWQSNIFYGFSNMPANDNPGAPNMNVDPMLVNIGAGGTGERPGEAADLSCYHTKPGSPAINAGVALENNGGRDYFGNEVKGIPDIGAYESGSVLLKILSSAYAIDQEEKVVTVIDIEKVTAEQLLDSLLYEEGVEITLKRGSAELNGGVRVAAGDVLVGEYDGERIEYTVTVEAGETSKVIPVEDMLATAGSEETIQSKDAAANVLDGNINTIWHTEWNGASLDKRYLTIELTNDYEVSGYIYYPRTGSSSGAVNGIITKYEIYVSQDNVTWEKVAQGSWAQNSNAKEVEFTAPVHAKYIKLQAVESVGGFVSAAEVRLTGERVYNDSKAPTAPVVKAENVTETTATLVWTPSSDENGVVEYVLMNGANEIATFDGEETVYTVADLQKDTVYEFKLYAVDEAGNRSEAGVETFTTEKGALVNPFEDVKDGDYYYEPVLWAVENGITTGTSATTFAPNEVCTRGHVVTFLWRAAGQPEPTTTKNPFSDVVEGTYYYKAVLWAVEKGITTGTAADRFSPNDGCTRNQVVTFLWRAAGQPAPEKTANTFTDVPADAYYTKAVLWAVENGITTGTSATTFAPEDECTRGQIVTFLYRKYK